MIYLRFFECLANVDDGPTVEEVGEDQDDQEDKGQQEEVAKDHADVASLHWHVGKLNLVIKQINYFCAIFPCEVLWF